ncbi:MAG: hypothetical protein AAFQ63_00680 [Cyanobacteria bacterium J06621_11]
MQLAAKLTIGWDDAPRSPFAATELHQRAITAPHYEKSLLYQLQAASAETRIVGLDQLFRQTCGGFGPIKQFLGALTYLPNLPSGPSPLICEIDLFAYTFLVGTHKIDRLLPITKTNDIELAHIQTGCTQAIATLEDFERTGTLPSEMSELDAHQYLSLRQIIARPSARDEWRILARLLISGPSTASNLERELGLDYTFAHQILCLFESIGIFTRWGKELERSSEETTFVIAQVAIPLVLFCLKQTLGLNLLNNFSVLLETVYE